MQVLCIYLDPNHPLKIDENLKIMALIRYQSHKFRVIEGQGIPTEVAQSLAVYGQRPMSIVAGGSTRTHRLHSRGVSIVNARRSGRSNVCECHMICDKYVIHDDTCVCVCAI